MVQQTSIGHKVSFEEYEAKYAGRRYEYIDGYAVPMGPEIEDENGELIVSPTKPKHGKVVARLTRYMDQHADDNDLGSVFGAEMGFIMLPETHQIRAADVSFVPKARMLGLNDSDWLPFPPDLAVEVISEHEKARDIRDKAQAYMDQGTRLLLLIYPDNRVIDLYRPNQPIITLRPGDVLDCTDVMTGFTVPVADIFAVLD